MKADFHCHTNCSDGQLSPHELVKKALELGLEGLSITDHDSVAACHQCLQLPRNETGKMKIYSGTEISCQWSGMDIHVVGLGFDLEDEALGCFLRAQERRRDERAESIAAKLEKKGAVKVLENARRIAGTVPLTRPHFAEAMIEQGLVKNHKQAFDRYLGQGKPCYQTTDWPSVEEANSVINKAGGVSVLAHPGRYRMTASKLRRLVDYFSETGGGAIEFVGGAGSKDRQEFLKSLCLQHGLMASPASDFHSEKQVWQKLGKTGELPKSVRPVWLSLSEPLLTL